VQDKYFELTIKLKEPFVDLVADLVTNLINDGVEIGTDRVIVRSEENLDKIIAQMEDMDPSIGISCILEEKENKDWIQAYKDSVQPLIAGKFYIHPEWYPPLDGKINILINPALAFGSGHHATTYSCLEAISKYVHPDQRVLDVGCGSGILSIAATKLGADVELCDVDPLSIQSAKENFKLNNERYDRLWEGSVNLAEGKYDIVIANIIADVLRAISSELKNSLSDKGILILSGILDKKESIVTEAFDKLDMIERKTADEWVTLVYKK